jgi:nucleotide-binding universal stress UspA family protein
MMFTRIAVPLDGSTLSEYALPYAVSLARLGNAPLTLVHVHRPFLPGEKLEALPQYQFQRIVSFDNEIDDESRRRESEHLDQLAERLRLQFGVQVDSRVLGGDVPEALAAYVRASGTELIVMSTHGYSGAWSTWLQSVSDAVVRRTSVPVLMLRPRPGAEAPDLDSIDLRRILVAVDGSMFSEAIIAPVIELAKAWGAQVTLITVVSPSTVEGSLWSWLPAHGDRPMQHPEEYLNDLVNRFPVSVPLPDTRLVVSDDASAAILAEAQQGEYDLIAMATHGRGGVRHLLVGSVADRVMCDTTVPVLLRRPLVPAPAAAEEHAAPAY